MPSGTTAPNLLGLSTQVPAKWIYISDGRYVNFHFGNSTIEFKHSNNKDISNIPTLVATIIQALKSIGKSNINEEQIKHLSQKLSKSEKESLLKYGKTTSVWIYQILKKISRGDDIEI
ncbi:DUF6088 family protein [Mycoplasma sp. CSL7503-lung]|uniref:DUF6088 family protein n=1 Tax=Mycoplasma sp. CSL7503-lung TaxID=536372 RepID=UPI0021D34CF4|nr:DUF6088 family protein [Mycoplasma sp. CSL7503-lung]MCU4706814.1 DUF6088 family protein [Mycoplasma sp. CSL7503-lung]